MMSKRSCWMIFAICSMNSARVRKRVTVPSAARIGPVPGIGLDMSPSLASAMMKSPLAYLPERIFASLVSRRNIAISLAMVDADRASGRRGMGVERAGARGGAFVVGGCAIGHGGHAPG